MIQSLSLNLHCKMWCGGGGTGGSPHGSPTQEVGDAHPSPHPTAFSSCCQSPACGRVFHCACGIRLSCLTMSARALQDQRTAWTRVQRVPHLWSSFVPISRLTGVEERGVEAAAEISVRSKPSNVSFTISSGAHPVIPWDHTCRYKAY